MSKIKKSLTTKILYDHLTMMKKQRNRLLHFLKILELDIKCGFPVRGKVSEFVKEMDAQTRQYDIDSYKNLRLPQEFWDKSYQLTDALKEWDDSILYEDE